MEINTLRPLQGQGKKLFVETYGCQMNVGDSEIVVSIMQNEGWRYTDDPREADVILINTCSIRDNAEQRIWGRLAELRGLRRRRQGVLIGIIGCMAERLKERLTEGEDAVDIVAGPDAYRDLPKLVREASAGGKGINVLLSREETYAEIAPVRLDRNGVSAFVAIMRGCNNYCSYCVVPYTRGIERSRDPETILAEVRSLFANGYREVTLLGQNVNSYAGDTDFPGLMRRILALPGDFWLRFMTSHPKDASRALVDAMHESEKAARHFHLPVQSGSDRVLARMNRRYTAAEYLEKVAYIRERLPDAAITSDVICGFPGETDEDFEKTVELVGRAGFDMLYTFVYSPRVGSAAAEMKDQIPHEEKVRRFERLSAFQNERAAAINASYVGKTLRVLSDGAGDNGIYSGRSSQNKIVTFDRAVAAGSFAQVEITGAQAYALSGVVTDR